VSELADRVAGALEWLERHGTPAAREGMKRYAIDAPQAFGVAVGDIEKLGKQLGRDHALAEALWQTGWYEARMLAAFVDEPARVAAEQMDRWAGDFDNWAICDTLCFKLFDRTPHAWGRVKAWRASPEEFVKRAAFALLASLALHDKHEGDEPFLRSLAWIEEAAGDERNFVKKGVSWALRTVGRRNAALHLPTLELADRLARSPIACTRWIGKDALRDLNGPAVQKRLAAQAARAASPPPARPRKAASTSSPSGKGSP
jgi:3-methyladenine DNA glycosylase AlkD